MNRRLALSWIGVMTLFGCADSGPLKPNDIQRIGLLPISEWPAYGSIAPFNEKLFTQAERSRGAPVSALAILIDSGLQARHDTAEADRRMLTSAVSSVKFFPWQVLVQSLARQIEARSMPITEINDPALAQAVRNKKTTSLPQDVHALLDIELLQAGYYASNRAGGLTPYFEISATLWDTVNPKRKIYSVAYWGDFREASRDPRYFAVPRDLVSTDANFFRSDAERIRVALTGIFNQVAAKVLDDVQSVLRKEPLLK